MGSKWGLFSLYGQLFPRYGLIFKIAIFGHQTWPLAKVPEIAHTVFLLQAVEIEIVFAQSFSRYRGSNVRLILLYVAKFKVGKVPEVVNRLSFYPRGPKLSLFCSTSCGF